MRSIGATRGCKNRKMGVSMSATTWFAWPSGLMLTLFNECVCGIRIGESVVIDPVIPEGTR